MYIIFCEGMRFLTMSISSLSWMFVYEDISPLGNFFCDLVLGEDDYRELISISFD
jgi:hypothetical protein